MSDTQWRGRLWLVRMLSLVFLMLAACGGSNGTGGSTTVAGMGRLILHVTTADQESAGLTPRAVVPGQTRQAGHITRLRVEVSGPGNSYAHRRRMSYSWTFGPAVPGHRNP
jgi:hypothetical protein